MKIERLCPSGFMKKNLVSVLFIVSLCSSAVSENVAAQSMSVPAGKTVLSNGFFSATEWMDANKLEISDSLEIFVKRDDRYLYLGLRTPSSSHTGIDLFLATSEASRHHLHVSSALSEAVYSDSGWSNPKWEENTWWIANKIGLYQDDSGRRTSEPEGFEFQISLDMLNTRDLYLALHLKRPDLKYPTVIEDAGTSNWLRLLLDY